MKTNIFITTIVLVLGAFFTFSQAQTDKTITRNESVSQFSSIRFEAVGDVNFEQSSEYSLRIEGPRKFVEKVLVKVKNGELILTYKEQNNKSKCPCSLCEAGSQSRWSGTYDVVRICPERRCHQ